MLLEIFVLKRMCKFLKTFPEIREKWPKWFFSKKKGVFGPDEWLNSMKLNVTASKCNMSRIHFVLKRNCKSYNIIPEISEKMSKIHVFALKMRGYRLSPWQNSIKLQYEYFLIMHMINNYRFWKESTKLIKYFQKYVINCQKWGFYHPKIECADLLNDKTL